MDKKRDTAGRGLGRRKRRHGALLLKIGARLDAFTESHGLGEVTGDVEFVLQRNPELMRRPDVAFVRAERLQDLSEDEWVEGAPDLAVEITSAADRPVEILERVWDYLQAGCRLVWVVDPRRRRVTSIAGQNSVRVLQEDDMLDGGEALPGFLCRVGDLLGLKGTIDE